MRPNSSARKKDRTGIGAPAARTLLWLAFFFLLLPPGLGAEPADPDSGKKNGDQIHITADRLVSKGTENQAEFIGAVRAVSKDFTITADRLKIFYAPAQGESTASAFSGQAIDKIEASGQVRIKTPGKIAKTEKAVYNKKKQIITLTGADSRVTSENGYIVGETIVMHTDTESVTVESGKEKRVEAVFNSEQMGDHP